ncbi:sigma factor [Nocardioides hwasunensis]|uniref:RNA polymerase sigma-70 region 2 domain-containing protein n=1 Tax=Nocardioides hwasunensis TaxID=397258 RepID=A0ABR8MGF0_9ACTN|nr:sigma factor [Nocardioides hwasunensis]MBD3914166.1 hypothetical protein [Nocardioides hwasunensis]
MPRASTVDRVQEVYATSYRRLVGQLTGVTGDPVEAEDAVMEAFARAVNSSRSFLAADNPEAWLRTVAVNVTRTRWRRSRFFRDVSHRLVAEEAYADLPDDRLGTRGRRRRRRDRVRGRARPLGQPVDRADGQHEPAHRRVRTRSPDDGGALGGRRDVVHLGLPVPQERLDGVGKSRIHLGRAVPVLDQARERRTGGPGRSRW